MRLRSLDRGPVLGLDLENRPSAYWFGDATTSQITAFGWKWVGDDQVNTLLLLADGRFVRDDGKRIRAAAAYELFRGEVRRAALVFGHNLRAHDLPTFTSGLQRLHMRMAGVLTSDTLKDGPRRRGLAANLASYADMYGLDGSKLSMSQHAWEQANQLHKEGIDQAYQRVVLDVLLQEQLRDRMLEVGHLKAPRVWLP